MEAWILKLFREGPHKSKIARTEIKAFEWRAEAPSSEIKREGRHAICQKSPGEQHWGTRMFYWLAVL